MRLNKIITLSYSHSHSIICHSENKCYCIGITRCHCTCTMCKESQQQLHVFSLSLINFLLKSIEDIVKPLADSKPKSIDIISNYWHHISKETPILWRNITRLSNVNIILQTVESGKFLNNLDIYRNATIYQVI